MYPHLQKYCADLVTAFGSITNDRKLMLDKITAYIVHKKKENKVIHLVYICTHNSRRSHFGQIWAHVAADYFNVKDVHTYSGGTEVTAFNINAIHALKRIGFRIDQITKEKNPIYQVLHDDKSPASTCFSKVFDHAANPSSNFAAIMTCGEAEENCPFIPGAEIRIATTYNDPKEFDNTALQDNKYDERCKQIALETFYLFSNIN